MQSVMSRNSNNYCMMGWYTQYKAQTNPEVKNKSYGQLTQVLGICVWNCCCFLSSHLWTYDGFLRTNHQKRKTVSLVHSPRDSMAC